MIKSTSNIKKILALVAAVFTLSAPEAQAQTDWTQDMNNLGGNDQIIQRAQAIHSAQRVRVVQNRTVNRRMRLELGGQFGGAAGGDSYLSVRDAGAFAEFHISPRWSVGARYIQHATMLTSEGDAVYTRAQSEYEAGGGFQVPLIDRPKNTLLGTVSFYPLYGKINLFDRGVTQFDVYLTAGAGQVNLGGSGTQSTAVTAGGGIGFWLSQYISTRLELRWQTYNDKTSLHGLESRRLDLAIATASLGILL